jgi:hypothetical protein
MSRSTITFETGYYDPSLSLRDQINRAIRDFYEQHGNDTQIVHTRVNLKESYDGCYDVTIRGKK